ncbi:phage tail protein [Sporosarcina sp. P33]|uniref:phage tail protein n=1 Tax=Sporosarcina sp. P33 TaxID=1930764 RepID=UPI0009C13189|nr:phage tail protein [Sporosarcina sp. P33]ARD47568.1 hypothetical protein SporoP33_04495 [Sporosarcina sp. P33]
MLGTWGDLVFVVSADEIKTFASFSRTETARWAKHEVHLQKPKAEFMGPDLGTLSFTMSFDAFFGLNPREEMNKFIKYVRNGVAHTLIIGGKRVGVHKWYMPDNKQDWSFLDNRGNVLKSSITVTMEEYV